MAPSHVSQLKKKATALGAALIHSDEATFRQDSTLHHTWARRGCQPVVPVTGQRTTVKVFGCVDVHAARFLYRREEVFNTVTYLGFLEQIARHYYPRPVIWIQDNASYHKHGDVWAWFSEHRHWWEVVNLPPYSPEFNATERLWHHTRMTGTHNRYFTSQEELNATLTRVFRSMQRQPSQIRGYMQPFI